MEKLKDFGPYTTPSKSGQGTICFTIKATSQEKADLYFPDREKELREKMGLPPISPVTGLPVCMN